MFLSSITGNTYTGLDCIYQWHDGCLIRSRNCLPFGSTWGHPRFYGGVCVAHIFSFFCVVLLGVFIFWVPCCDVRYDCSIITVFGSSLLPVVCRRAHVLLTLFVFVCVQWCPTHIVLCFCFVFLRLVYPMLPVSLDCPFLISLFCHLVLHMFVPDQDKDIDFPSHMSWYFYVQ